MGCAMGAKLKSLMKRALRPITRRLRPKSVKASQFEGIYAANPDPWGLASSEYEANRYTAIVEALPRQNYGAGLEVGCAIGILTAQLASRCGRLLAVDGAAKPLEQARERTAGFSGVELRQAEVPADWPEETFDLIVFAEILYYLNPSDLRRVAEQTIRSLRPGGDLILAHFTGKTDFPLTGDEASKGFIRALGGAVTMTRAERPDKFRLDVLRRV